MIIPMSFLVFATYTDIRFRKIKNYTTYPMFLLGVFMSDKPIMSIGIGILLGIALSLIPGFLAGMGDIKLIIATGTWLSSFVEGIYLLLATIALLTLYNIGAIIKKEGFKNLLEQLKLELFFLFFTKKVTDTKINNAPLAPFIMIGFLSVALLF